MYTRTRRHAYIHTLSQADPALPKTPHREIFEAARVRIGGAICSVGDDVAAETSKRLVRSPCCPARLLFLLLKLLAARSTLFELPCSFMRATRSAGSPWAMMCPIVASRSISHL